jgi:deoxyadenosine/deoxycytidine kinase
MSKWYIIEGNIGSGKTTLLDKLAEHNNYEVIREPVDIWQNIKNDKNENILQQFYKDPNRYAYLFQTIVFKTRLQSLDKIQEKEIRFSHDRKEIC